MPSYRKNGKDSKFLAFLYVLGLSFAFFEFIGTLGEYKEPENKPKTNYYIWVRYVSDWGVSLIKTLI